MFFTNCFVKFSDNIPDLVVMLCFWAGPARPMSDRSASHVVGCRPTTDQGSAHKQLPSLHGFQAVARIRKLDQNSPKA